MRCFHYRPCIIQNLVVLSDLLIIVLSTYYIRWGSGVDYLILPSKQDRWNMNLDYLTDLTVV